MPKYVFRAITQHVAMSFITKCNEAGFQTKGSVTTYPEEPSRQAVAEIISEALLTQLHVVLGTMQNVWEIEQTLRYHSERDGSVLSQPNWPFPVTDGK